MMREEKEAKGGVEGERERVSERKGEKEKEKRKEREKDGERGRGREKSPRRSVKKEPRSSQPPLSPRSSSSFSSSSSTITIPFKSSTTTTTSSSTSFSVFPQPYSSSSSSSSSSLLLLLLFLLLMHYSIVNLGCQLNLPSFRTLVIAYQFVMPLPSNLMSIFSVVFLLSSSFHSVCHCFSILSLFDLPPCPHHLNISPFIKCHYLPLVTYPASPYLFLFCNFLFSFMGS